MEAILTKNLTKMYGKARGILEVNLAVEQGELFGFIGPNGAGKSTTIRTLLGLISATSGFLCLSDLLLMGSHSLRVMTKLSRKAIIMMWNS